MNFEVEVNLVPELLDWLTFLREELHREIPGAELMWYDSVLHNGKVRWQSALTEENFKFFNVCDSFFTDYHWKLPKL